MPVNTISRPYVGLPRRCSVAERLAYWLFHGPIASAGISSALPTAEGNGQSQNSDEITVVCISDTHNALPGLLPAGDILIHAGDLSQYGTFAEVQAQLAWLDKQPHPHKVVIAGNHDLLLDTTFVAAHPDRELGRYPGRRRSDLDWGGVKYLEHQSAELWIQDKARSVRVFGSPWTPACGSGAFQYSTTEAARAKWENAVPAGTDLVVTHGPPKGHLDDGGKGCGVLLAELWRARPKAVVCGHIHAGRGQKLLRFDLAQACYENVVLKRWPWMSVVGLAICVLWRLVVESVHWVSTDTLRGRGRIRSELQLVNAAIASRRGPSASRDAMVLVLRLA